jgi:hypothetical protein
MMNVAIKRMSGTHEFHGLIQVTVEKSSYSIYTGNVTMPEKGPTVDLDATLSPIPTPSEAGNSSVSVFIGVAAGPLA